MPGSRDATGSYRIQLIKCGALVQFSINELEIFTWEDDGRTYGPVLSGGKIGFRQMAGLIAEYGNLEVREVIRKDG